ncbi:MAG: hypothetical protein NTX50_00695 [Candidatus Sumerlaeota bacterium]|nr:hypothetical protein [Candidatus Sumerlaeota bacterium]
MKFLAVIVIAVTLLGAAGFAQPSGDRETSSSASGANRPAAREFDMPSGLRPAEEWEALWPFAMSDMADQLGLTEKQMAQIKEKVYETRRKTIDLKAKADLTRLDLELMLTSDTVHEKEAFALVDKIKEIESEIEKLRISLTLAQNEILTQYQRRLLSRLVEIERKRQNQRQQPAPPEPKSPRRP